MVRFFQTVSFRLFAGLLVLLLAAFALYSYVTVRFYTHQLQNQVYQAADRVSDLIKSSTHYSMLLNRREDVYQIIRTIGREPGVEGIRIYNKRGQITYSTDSTELDKMVDLHAEACLACHEREQPLRALSMSNRIRVYDGGHGHRVLGLINPVRNEADCSAAGCHDAPEERSVVGVLDVRMSLASVDQAVAVIQRRTLAVASMVLLGIAVASGAFVLLTLRRPVRRLMRGTQQISTGNLDHEIPITSADELGELARSFNSMTRSLKRAEQENREWARTLEERVREKTEELERIHERVMHIEKMASLGKLGASVAHELNNPLAGILAYSKLVSRRLKGGPLSEEKLRETLDDLDLISHETERCGNIVKSLLLFARREGGEVGVVGLRDVVTKSAKLIAHHMEISHVAMETSFQPDDATVIGDEDQLQQALVALFVNAVEAMPDGGTLRVAVRQDAPDADARIEVTDTGMGIRPEDMPHIFEPFYSTKEAAKGTGLGLSIVYGIVERHGGDISVRSEPGRGSTFVMTLPRTGLRGTT